MRHRRLGFVPPDVGFVPTDVGCTPVLLPRSSRLESLWSEQKELKELKVKGLESLWSEQKELKELKVKCGWRKSVNQQIRYGFMKRVS